MKKSIPSIFGIILLLASSSGIFSNPVFESPVKMDSNKKLEFQKGNILTSSAEPRPTTFAVIGDFGGGSSDETAVANVVKSWSPEFVITTGDNRYLGLSFDVAVGKDYCQFLSNAGTGTNCGGNESALNAFFPSPGNHDYTESGGISLYLDYFNLPGTGISSSNTSGSEKYYDFIQGPVHFFVIDSYDAMNNGTMNIQQNWLKQQLALSTTVWNIVYFHYPPYSSGDHGSIVSMQWPFAEWGADAVLNGHDHTYERIMKDGIVYFVNGIGGRSIYPFVTNPLPETAFRYNAKYGAQKVVADENYMTFSFINTSYEVIDEYTIYKTLPPVVNVTAPLNNAYLENPQTIAISADASDPDGTISKVEFFVDGNLIATDVFSPYSVNWSIPSNGSYSITARATDDMGLTTTSNPVNITAGTLNESLSVKIGSGSDDVEEAEDGYMYLNSSDLELVYDNHVTHNNLIQGNQTVGLRFTGLNIPNGAQITKAYVQFTCDETLNNPGTLNIYGHASDNSPVFSNSGYNVSGRVKTTSNISWNPSSWTTIGEKGISQQTPDISAIIQEIVNRTGFSTSSAISIIINGTGTRTAISYDGNAGSAPVLNIEYQIGVQNSPPVFKSNPIVKADAMEDAQYSVSISADASDEDGDNLSFSKVSGPAWLTVATNGTLSGKPLQSDVGANSWLVQVSDGKGGTAQTTLQITVQNVNDYPVFKSNPIVKADAMEDMQYSASISADASDEDGDNLSFSKVSGPAWLTVATNGALSGKPLQSDVGANSWLVEVSDGKGGTVQATLQILVNPKPNINYCESFGSTVSAFINSIQINGFTNNSGNNSGYKYFENLQIISIVSESLVSLALTPEFYGRSTHQYWSVWIDYNKNGIFESFEQVFASLKSKSTVNGSFISGTFPGLTRMRISMSDGGTPLACGNIGNGEVEDYLVNILPAEVEVPVVEFIADKTIMYSEETINFTDLSVNFPTSWIWDFGNGQTSNLQNPSVTYTTAGTFSVTLTAANSAGSDTETKTNYITVNPQPSNPPIADFTANPNLAYVGDPVQFYDISINSPTSWSWSFGDGQTSTLQNPTAVYQNPGAYTVRLTATNSYGSDTEEKTEFIQVNAIPPSIYCIPLNITNSDDYISSVSIGTVSNLSGKETTGYNYYLSPEFNFNSGQQYSITLIPQNTTNRNFWRIRMDINGDGDFKDINETLFTANNKKGIVSGTILIPTTVSVTKTRLRITMKTGSSPSICEDGYQGEVEDYVANINLSPIKSGEIQSIFTSNQGQPILSEFNVYPNPARDKIYLQFFNWSGNKEIYLIDLTGKVVFFKEITVELLEVDLSVFPNGIYLIEAKNKNFRNWKKIRIQ